MVWNGRIRGEGEGERASRRYGDPAFLSLMPSNGRGPRDSSVCRDLRGRRRSPAGTARSGQTLTGATPSTSASAQQRLAHGFVARGGIRASAGRTAPAPAGAGSARRPNAFSSPLAPPRGGSARPRCPCRIIRFLASGGNPNRGSSAGSRNASIATIWPSSISSTLIPCGIHEPSSARSSIVTAGRPFAQVGRWRIRVRSPSGDGLEEEARDLETTARATAAAASAASRPRAAAPPVRPCRRARTRPRSG